MEFTRTLALVTITLLIIAGALFVLIPSILANKLISGSGKNTTLSFSDAISQFKNTTQTVLVHVLPDRNTVLFNLREVNLVVLAVNGIQAANLTHSSGNTGPVNLVIAGLNFPEVDIQPNSTMDITFVNMVSTQNCDLIISTLNPSSVQNSAIQISQDLGAALATPLLEEANLTQGVAHVYSATLPSVGQDLWYTSTCTPSVYGHIGIS